VRSEAIFRIHAALELKSRLMPLLSRLPRWCTDLVYRLFVRFRYRLFGKLDVCPVPPPEQRDRFLS
jgi:predicted DCC family thiol-disulfide oxidoreductase YuxK